MLSSIIVTLISFCSVYGWKLPQKTLGFYCLIADDSIANYTSTANWQPELYDFQMNGTNVIFLTFINPQDMPTVPPAMANLAMCKGQPGCPPKNTPVIFSVGGESYGNKAWPWLTSSSAAESMAAEVAQWDTKYGANGIDLDIEGPAGSQTAGNNLVIFAKKLRQLNPKMIITQPVYGSPQINAENTMVNEGFTASGQSLGLIDSVGIMVYNDEGSLQYVKDYGNATSEWDGFPIKVNVPYSMILAGINGNAGSSSIMKMASDIKSEGLGGMMVWLSSVMDKAKGSRAFTYGGGSMDASTKKDPTWAQAIPAMGGTSTTTTTSTTSTTTTTTSIPGGGCLWKAASSKNTLNLTQYQGTTLAKVDDIDNQLVYALSPCGNMLTCNKNMVNSYLFNITSMECLEYLSMWKDGAVVPKYDSVAKLWQFVYTNGESCNGLEPVFEVYWVCDPMMVNKAEIVSAQASSECFYQMHINSSSACN